MHMKYDYNPLSNSTKSDPVAQNAIKNVMYDEKTKEKKNERRFINKIIKRLNYFLDKCGFFLLDISIISKKYSTEFNYRKK